MGRTHLSGLLGGHRGSHPENRQDQNDKSVPELSCLCFLCASLLSYYQELEKRPVNEMMRLCLCKLLSGRLKCTTKLPSFVPCLFVKASKDFFLDFASPHLASSSRLNRACLGAG